METNKKLYSETEGAKYIGIKIFMLRDQRKKGFIKFCQIGKKIFYTKIQMDQYVRSIQI